MIFGPELTAAERDRYRVLCGFTAREERVFSLRIAGKSIVEISMDLSVSTATVSRCIRSIGDKIRKVDGNAT